MAELIRTTSLYFRDPSINADKVYFVYLRHESGGYTVDFAYGRRGSALTAATKTSAPVPKDAAEKVEAKLIKEKTSKGYVTDASGERVIGTETGESSGYLPQLLNSIEESGVAQVMSDASVGMQPKMDGERRLLLIDGGLVRGINRKGEYVAVPEAWQALAGRIKEQVLIDGEAIGDALHAFDLFVDGSEVTGEPFVARYKRLSAIVEMARVSFLRLVPLATTGEAKQEMLAREREANGEGVVLRSLDATYSAGRPNSGGPVLKLKFWESATCIAGPTNGDRRSISLLMLDTGGVARSVGNVTIPPNADVPSEGQLVEVRYLYRAGPTGSLFQPTYIGPRRDMARNDATLAQISRVKQDAQSTAVLAA